MTTSTQTQPKTSTIKFTCIRREVAASSDYVGRAVFWKLGRLDRDPKVEIVYVEIVYGRSMSKFEVYATVSKSIGDDASEIEQKSYLDEMNNIINVLGGIIERGGWLITTYSTSYSTKFSNSIFKEVGGDLHA